MGCQGIKQGFSALSTADLVWQRKHGCIHVNVEPCQGTQGGFAEQLPRPVWLAMGQERPGQTGAALPAVGKDRHPFRHTGPERHQQIGQVGTEDQHSVVTLGQLVEQPAFAGPTLEAVFGQRDDAVDAVQLTRQRHIDRMQQRDDLGIGQAIAQGPEDRRCRHEVANFGGLNDQDAVRPLRTAQSCPQPQQRRQQPGQQQVDHRAASSSTCITPAT